MSGNSSRRRTTTLGLVPLPTIRNSQEPDEQQQEQHHQPLVPELVLDLVPTARLLVV